MMIYDVSNGYGYANVMLADSGKMSFTEDKKYLFLQLMHGESFEDLKDDRPNRGNSGMLYRRESFTEKEILIPFDANFNRMGDETMRNQYIGKNLKELNHTIDSVKVRIDSLGDEFTHSLRSEPLCGLPQRRVVYKDGERTEEGILQVEMPQPIDMDSVFASSTPLQKRNFVENAKNKATRIKQNMEFRAYTIEDIGETMRRHQIELMKKFTLSFACLIFFFIGAPLGAIIRKGGLGMPIVVSVLLFIIYYIIDNSGYKLARDGHWAVWEGIWLSSEVLLPLGIFLTYKAINDSAVFNPDAYRNFFRRIVGVQQVRNIVMKEVIMDDVVVADAKAMIADLRTDIEAFINAHQKRQSYLKYWTRGYSRAEIDNIITKMESVVEYLENSRSQLVINKVMDYPCLRRLLFYYPVSNAKAGIAIAAIFPIGLIGYFIGIKCQNGLKRDMKTSLKVCDELISILEKDIQDK